MNNQILEISSQQVIMKSVQQRWTASLWNYTASSNF